VGSGLELSCPFFSSGRNQPITVAQPAKPSSENRRLRTLEGDGIVSVDSGLTLI
jgi:hypothetical protein